MVILTTYLNKPEPDYRNRKGTGNDDKLIMCSIVRAATLVPCMLRYKHFVCVIENTIVINVIFFNKLYSPGGNYMYAKAKIRAHLFWSWSWRQNVCNATDGLIYENPK